MSTLLSPEGLFAVSTAIAGVLLFCLAARLPSLFPPALTRFVGFSAVCTSLAPLWVLTESWQWPAGVGLPCLAVMVAAHLWQTRRRPVADEAGV
ncbi:MAG TPA: hypothetical protein VGL77_09410 [Armatimonadota bacterium]|jgi:hypothetical protein